MKKLVITALLAILGMTFCEAQSLQNAAKQKQEQEARQQKADKEQKEREQQALRVQIEQQYQSTISSAEKNFYQQQYEQAKQDYKKARELKPENSASINQKIAEIEQKIRDQVAEFEHRYQSTIASAESNFNQQKYEQAKQNYLDAIILKPENTASINVKIVEIDEKLLQLEKVELERRYQNTITSAQSNFNQRRFTQAKQDYLTAIELKPENAAYINPKLAEIERKMNEPATLYIYHKAPSWDGNINISNLNSKRYDIFLDKELVGRTENKWKTIVTVKAPLGTKTVSAAINGRKATVNINFEPGGTYYVCASYSVRRVGTGRYTTSSNGTRSEVTETEYTPVLTLMSKNVGESEFNAIKDK